MAAIVKHWASGTWWSVSGTNSEVVHWLDDRKIPGTSVVDMDKCSYASMTVIIKHGIGVG